ncbi:unnamed protein product, partial [Lampetra fluviatilis]
VQSTWRSLHQDVELSPERRGRDLCGVEVLLHTLKVCTDDETCLNILVVLADLLRGGSVRRVSALVSLGASQCLLSLLARLSTPPHSTPHRERLLTLVLTSLASLGIRDKKFARPLHAASSGHNTTNACLLGKSGALDLVMKIAVTSSTQRPTGIT